MKARLLLLGVFLSLFVSASQAQDASPTDELETAPPAASDSISTLSLSEMFEDPDWIWYLATCVDLYLVQADTVLSEDAYESPYAFFGSPEVQTITPGEMWVWLHENFPMDAANLGVIFDAWRSRAAYPPAGEDNPIPPTYSETSSTGSSAVEVGGDEQVWHIDRTGDARAIALLDGSGTIRGLADEIGLNAAQWAKWLHAEDEKTNLANLSLDAPLDESSVFSVPNTAFVDAASYSWGGLGLYLMHYSLDLRSAWRGEGLKVVYTSTWSTTKDSIITNLSSADIYKYAYIGHGASGLLTGIKDPNGKGDEEGILWPKPYTRYGIARMEIIACGSNDEAGKWRENVSQNGTLRTVKGEFRLFNRNFFDEVGQ